jgi:hypothetical protein
MQGCIRTDSFHYVSTSSVRRDENGSIVKCFTAPRCKVTAEVGTRLIFLGSMLAPAPCPFRRDFQNEFDLLRLECYSLNSKQWWFRECE